jgi:hypothetical protein
MEGVMKGMILTKHSKAEVAGLLMLCLGGPGVGGYQALSAQEKKATTTTVPPTTAKDVPPGTFFAVLRITHYNAESKGQTQTLRDGKDESLPGWIHRTTYALPPVPSRFLRGKRRIDVEIRLAGEGGQSTVLLSERNIQLPWRGCVPLGQDCMAYSVEHDGEQIRVSSGILFR